MCVCVCGQTVCTLSLRSDQPSSPLTVVCSSVLTVLASVRVHVVSPDTDIAREAEQLVVDPM